MQVTVASTPSGRADAICWQGDKAVFALPHEEQLSLAEVLQHFQQDTAGAALDRVLYVQAQNDSLNAEFPQLLKDIDKELPWASAAFGTPPDAVNLWIGSHRSVTSFHRDHYENMYAVVSGTKRFSLLPPCDRYRMGMMDVPVGRHTPGPGGWGLQLESPERKVPWCPLDENLNNPCSGHSPGADPLPEPLVVEVHAGEVLYLPSLWYHMVQQEDDESGRVIAVNYWFDMQYDCKYAYAQMLERLSDLCSTDAATQRKQEQTN